MNLMRGLLLTVFILFSTVLVGQVDSTSTGEVVDAEIVIQKDRKIVLPQSNKINTPVKNGVKTAGPLSLQYQPVDPEFSWPAYKSEVSFKEIEDEDQGLSKFQNSIKAGYGNFGSPIGELLYFKNLDKVKFNTRIFHESFREGPIEGSNSSTSNTELRLGATISGKAFEVTPRFGVEQIGYKFYGNTNNRNTGFSTAEALEVQSRSVNFGFGIKGDVKDLTYSFNPMINNTSQSVKDGPDINKELVFEFKGDLNLKINKPTIVGFDLSGNSGDYTGGLNYNRSLLTIAPWISHRSSSWKIKGGLGLSTDKTGSVSNRTGLYPFFNADWQFDPKWSLSGSINSGIKWNSLESLLEQNQFLDDSLVIHNTELQLAIGGSIKGSLTNNLTVTSGVKWESYNAIPIFLPSTDSSRFIVGYDNGPFQSSTTDVLSFRGGLVYAPTSSTSAGMEFTLYNYTTSSLAKAWHLPSASFKFFILKNIKEKFFINTEFIALGGIEAPGTTATEIIDLDSFLDVNLNLDYKATERFSIFLKLNNLLNNEYERYIGYPVRGASFKVGGKYRF